MSTKETGETLLQTDVLLPLSDERPCGDNLEYDPEFLIVFAKAAEQPETQYGDFVNVPEGINWNEVEREVLRLLLRTKDIRVLILLLRSWTQLKGAEGMRDGMRLLSQLIAAYPQHIHPQAVCDEDVSEEEAAMVRGNALAALIDPEGVLSDIRGIVLAGNAALRLKVRDVERALSIPRPADALAPDSVRRQLLDLRLQGSPALQAFGEAAALIDPLQQWEDKSLQDAAPDLTPLKKLLAFLLENDGRTPAKRECAKDAPAAEETVAPLSGEQVLPFPGPSDISPSPQVRIPVQADIAPEPEGRINNRFDALQRIKDIRAWFEQNEPSSPAIPLLRQSERMIGKRFSEVVDAIPLELLQKWDVMEE